MADYTVQIVFINPQQSAKKTYVSGDIVGIYSLIVDSPNKSGRLALIHVLNAPDTINFDNLIKEFVRCEYLNITSEKELYSRSAWSVNVADMKDLETERQQTISWNDARDCFIRKFDDLTGGQYYDGLINGNNN